MLTVDEAEEKGFTIDRCTYPYFGYKGPRFAPIEHCEVMTDRECEMEDRIKELERFFKVIRAELPDDRRQQLDNLLNRGK